MFNVTGGELFMILLVALIVLGPERLPAAARRVVQVMGQLRDLSEGFKREVSQALDDPGEPIVKPATRPRLTALDGGATTEAATQAAPGAAGSDPVATAGAAFEPRSNGTDPAPMSGNAPDQPAATEAPVERSAATATTPDPPTTAGTVTAAGTASTPAAGGPDVGAAIADPAPAREPQVAAPERAGGGGGGESAGS